MAETVKKSRIVSENNDVNLEEALMEEFNMRLKNCMSQDNLKDVDDLNKSKNLNSSSSDFIQIERDCEDSNNINNALIIDEKNASEEIYENIEIINKRTDDKDVVANYVDMDLKKNNSGDDDVRIYEEIADLEMNKENANIESEMKSVKDRMLLSTDVVPCLLFTQTITSPMLTPSDDNVDFLNDFQNKENIIDDIDNGIKSLSIAENLYENTKFQCRNDLIYENLQQNNDEIIYENVKIVNQNDDRNDLEQINENIEKITENINEIVENNLETIEKITKTIDEINEDETTKTIIIKNKMEELEELKTINIMKQINKFECTINNNSNNNSNNNNYNNSSDLTNVSDDDSTAVTQSYVETTTFETNMNNSNDKSLKKKKSKKSRKEEKENISVNGITNNNVNKEESFYNVNVKNLCRSFGDLTKVGQEKMNKTNHNYYNNNNNNKNNNRARTKSLNDADLITPSYNNNNNNNNNNNIENVFSGVSVRVLKSSFNKFDALQKKNVVLHVRSSDSSKAQEKFNGAQIDTSNCKSCDKAVFQMEQIKAEKSIWHKNCFRCKECNKQLTVDTYQSHEGTLYCKPHFKALFAPKAVEDDNTAPKSRKPELIIRENQPLELPPDVVRASDKPDLGLEELQSLNVKERFQVFENYQVTNDNTNEVEKSIVNVKRSPSILSKLARFQAKGMEIGVSDDVLNGIPIEEESGSENDDNDNDGEGMDDDDLVRSTRIQKEKPFHFTGMLDVKNKWEHQNEENNLKDERREERKQEIQTIRNRLFMGKQGKMKEAYQQAIIESESCTNMRRKMDDEPTSADTKSIKERFEKGDLINNNNNSERTIDKDNEETEVYESEISKNSRSLFLELDANATKPPQMTPLPTSKLDVKKTREAYLTKIECEDVVKSTNEPEDVEIRTADIQERFKFFETYREPEKAKREFRITPPRDGQVKGPTPDRDVYHDPNIVRAEEIIEDSVVAKESHTATKMLNKFRQMEENLMNKEHQQPSGPKPLKCFTPPPEPVRVQDTDEDDDSDENDDDDDDDYEEDEDEEEGEEADNNKLPDDLIEAQKAARAKQLRAKFERWEEKEMKREQNTINFSEEFGEEQSQIESTKSLRARFESLKENNQETNRTPRVKVNRFVELPNLSEICTSCNSRVYPLEKVSVHGRIYHKNCFKCMECSCVLRMDSYSYNQGLLYCMAHFKRLFISKGNYDTGFGLGQHKEKWNATVA